MKRETSFIAQFYVFVWLLVLPIGAYAQGNKVSLKCSNMALTSALLEVEKQSGYYKSTTIRGNCRLTRLQRLSKTLLRQQL